MTRGLYLLLLGCIFLIILLPIIYYLAVYQIIVDLRTMQARSDISQIALAFRDDEGYQQVAIEQSALARTRVIIVDEEYLLLADSAFQGSEVSGRYIDATISDAADQGSSYQVIRRRPGVVPELHAAGIFESEGRVLIISTRYRLDEMRTLSTRSWFFFISLFIVFSLLLSVLVLRARNRMHSPIKSLVQHTRKGYLDRIEIDSERPELIELSMSFNSLVGRYERLIESERDKYSRISTLLATLKTGIIMVDKKGAIILVNPMAERLLELDTPQIFNAATSSPTNEKTKGNILSSILQEAHVVNSRKESRMVSYNDTWGRTLDVEIEVTYSKYRPYEHFGALIIIRDVTTVRRLEQLKDQFVSNVSHELRTPLTVIGGCAQMLMDQPDMSDEDKRTAVNLIGSETERLKSLISQLLELSRIQNDLGAVTQEQFDPVLVIKEVVGQVDTIHPGSYERTEISSDDDRFLIQSVAPWFSLIIYNLYENAVKYSPEPLPINIRTQRKDGYLSIKIEDHGPGIAAEHIDRIFDKFYRADLSRSSTIQGTGLGLSIVKQLCTQLQVAIEVESRPDEGAVFTLRVPLHLDALTS